MTASSQASHSAVQRLEFQDNILLWGGRKVTDIALEAGTPFYAYDRQRIAERVSELRSVLPHGLKIHYAMKANPMPEVVGYFAGLVDGLDVASEAELQVALGTGTRPEDISFAGPGKRDSELEAAIEAGITINIESEAEMRRIASIAETLDKNACVAIRVNPSFELKSSGMKMGGRPSQFGVDAERVPAMLDNIKAIGLDFRGLHVFSGSQNLRPESICECLEKTVELVLSLADASPLPFASVNLGGGLGIPYFPNEKPLDLSLLRDSYHAAVDTLARELHEPELITELGRYLVGESGIYVCRVIDIKESRGHRFAICDGGLHHHLAASGNFGQVLRKNYPLVSVEQSAGGLEAVSVVGPLCTPLDLLGDNVNIHPLREGSLVAVLQSGAYGRSASPQDFLSHPSCRELLV